MRTESDAKMVSVYVNSTDQHRGRPLYATVVEHCLSKGIAGVTVLRAVEGYGAGHRLHTTRLLELNENLPLIIEIIDAAERVGPLIADLEKLIGEGLIVVSDVRVIRLTRG